LGRGDSGWPAASLLVGAAVRDRQVHFVHFVHFVQKNNA
jgi:hypothetical protein